MKVFAISDLHLSFSQDKPMDIFGAHWNNYTEKISNNWSNKVGDDDVVVIAGDVSWAMRIEDAVKDVNWIKNLPGKKIIIRGNHDYWWGSLTKVRQIAGEICVLQNDAVKYGNNVFCGSRGWILPNSKDFGKNDEKIYARELIRLKMSLDNANRLRQDGDKLFAILHYPPIDGDEPDDQMEKLFKAYGVETVIYGHVHGKPIGDANTKVINGIKYYITSCDLLNFDPIEIV